LYSLAQFARIPQSSRKWPIYKHLAFRFVPGSCAAFFGSRRVLILGAVGVGRSLSVSSIATAFCSVGGVRLL